MKGGGEGVRLSSRDDGRGGVEGDKVEWNKKTVEIGVSCA